MAYTDSDRVKPIVVLTSMASMSQGFSRSVLREFAARDQNEIVFIERSFTKDSIAANFFRKLKVFPIEEIRAIKPASTYDASSLFSGKLHTAKTLPTGASLAPSSSSHLIKTTATTNDPRTKPLSSIPGTSHKISSSGTTSHLH